MNLFPRRLTLHLARSVLRATLAAWAVLLGFVTIINFVEELRDVGKESYTLSHAVLYMLLTTPRRMYELFPTVAVIGSLLGLGWTGGALGADRDARGRHVQACTWPGQRCIPLLMLTHCGRQHRDAGPGRRTTRAGARQQQVAGI
jgi:hypothetical protein